MNEYDLQVAKALEMARAKSGLSQEKLAKRLGISKPTVASRERGTSPVTLADIINWCVACSIPARRCMDACIYHGLRRLRHLIVSNDGIDDGHPVPQGSV